MSSLGNNSLLDSSIIENNIAWASGYFDVIKNSTISKNYRGVMQGFTLINCVVDSNVERGIYMNTGSVWNCTIRYNGVGIFWGNPVTINNCIIKGNQTGIETAINNTITNCVIDSNLIGIDNGSQYNSGYNNINNCQIRYNGTGIFDQPDAGSSITQNYIEYNGIGIDLKQPDSIFCNKICYSSSYDLKYSSNINTNCVANNYWCTPDSASTQVVIYDAHDNVSVGIVNYMPIDSTCYLGNPNSMNEIENSSFAVFPNPSTGNFTINSSEKISSVAVMNMLGEKIYSENYSFVNFRIDLSSQSNGIYFIQIRTDKGIATQKLVLQK